MKKRSASKPITPISQFRGVIGSKQAKPLADALSEIKSKGNVEKFAWYYSLAVHSTIIGRVIRSSRQVKELNQLGSSHVLQQASLSREIQWAAIICYTSGIVISKFIPLRLDFFSKLEAGKFQDAIEVLDRIDKECGKSLWTLENRIGLLSVSEGFESQKKYVNSITTKYPQTNVAFMAAHIGERNEHRVTARAFEQRLSHRATMWEIEPSQLAYIFFRLCNTIEPNEAAYSAILTYEASFSAIDLYESLLAIARRVKHMPFYDPVATEAALKYLINIEDHRKTALIEFLEGGSLTCVVQPIPEYHRSFRSGNYEEAIDLANSKITLSPFDIDALVTYSKACTVLGRSQAPESWFSQLVVPNLCSFYTGSATAESAVDELIKISNNFRHADFSTPLIILMKARTHRWFYRISEQCDLIKIFIPNFPSFIETPSSDNSNIESENYLSSSRMYSSILSDDIEAALLYAKELDKAEDSYFRTLGKSYQANLLSKGLRTSEALEKSVMALIEHPSLVEFTPLMDIIRSRGNKDFKDLRASPVLPTAFYIHIEQTESTEKEVALKVALKNFLSSHDISKPSQFRPSGGYADIEAFFLAYVCTQETMELGGAFYSQLDLDRERMAICANLATAFPETSEVFNQEIVDLTRRINIEDCVEFLESSRIFVDEIGIHKWSKKNLLSQFLRYKDHNEIGIDSSIVDLSKEVTRLLKSNEDFIQKMTNYLIGYDISADGLLQDVVTELSQAFLQLPRFGLDSFLSSRVRHGSFVGYIRRPLESHRIVTKKSSDNAKYYDNEYMIQRWGIQTEKEKRLINQRLANLSAAVDASLDEMVDKFLHVRSKSHPQGMVSYWQDNRTGFGLIKSWVVLAKTQVGGKIELEDFCSYCFQNLFWPGVRQSLDNLKMFIQGEYTERLSGLLNQFIDSLSGLLTLEQRNRIQMDIVQANIELRDALRRVSLWFSLPQINTQTISMPLTRVLEIGLASSQNARFGFNPSVCWDIEPDANINVQGPVISTLNDLAFLIFTNIAKHSGFEDPSYQDQQPKINVAAIHKEGSTTVTISNNICKSISLSQLKEKLASINERISKRDFDTIDKQTEGTGLIRLAIYFDSNGLTDRNFSFWLSDDEQTFNVQLRLPNSLVKAMEM